MSCRRRRRGQHHRRGHRDPDAEVPAEPAEVGARAFVHAAHPIDRDRPRGERSGDKTSVVRFRGVRCSVIQVILPSFPRCSPSRPAGARKLIAMSFRGITGLIWYSGSPRGGNEMPEHTIGTREEWQAARDELAKLEADQAKRNEEVKQKRLALPWVPVEKEYEFDTEDGKKTLAELFDGRSQLLAYNVMFGPDYTLGACPGCTSLADGLDGSLVHLNHRDVTLICFSRAPIERLIAYKRADGMGVPVRLHLQHRIRLRLRPRADRGAGTGRPRGQGDGREPARVARGVVGPGRGRAEGRAAREPELDRLRPRERHRLPHLHGVGARPVRRAVLQLPGGANAKARAGRDRGSGGRTSTRTDMRRLVLQTGISIDGSSSTVTFTRRGGSSR